MNLTQYSLNFKTLSKPQMNLLAKLDEMGVIVDMDNRSVTNPTNGYTEMLDPAIATLVRWVYKVYRTYDNGKMNYNGTKVAIAIFDRVRYLILDLDKQAFRNFID